MTAIEHKKIPDEHVCYYINNKDRYQVSHKLIWGGELLIGRYIKGINIFFKDRETGKTYCHTSCFESVQEVFDFFGDNELA